MPGSWHRNSPVPRAVWLLFCLLPALAAPGRVSQPPSVIDGREALVRGGEGVEFASVNDTVLKGAQIAEGMVLGTMGGDLSLISEQDIHRSIRSRRTAVLISPFPPPACPEAKAGLIPRTSGATPTMPA